MRLLRRRRRRHRLPRHRPRQPRQRRAQPGRRLLPQRVPQARSRRHFLHKIPRPQVQIDNNPYNLVAPPDGQLYVGWTVPGEWFNLTVNVARVGRYTADLLYTSNRGGTLSLDVNGHPSAPITIPSTANPADPIAWRQWHHWNLLRNATTLQLPAGRTVLTVHILTEGQMNLATLTFKPAP